MSCLIMNSLHLKTLALMSAKGCTFVDLLEPESDLLVQRVKSCLRCRLSP
jgi:hypothetical protein